MRGSRYPQGSMDKARQGRARFVRGLEQMCRYVNRLTGQRPQHDVFDIVRLQLGRTAQSHGISTGHQRNQHLLAASLGRHGE